MAAASYFLPDTSHHSSAPQRQHSPPPQHSPLRPMLLVESHHHPSDNSYHAGSHTSLDEIHGVQKEDKVLKTRIRRLRVVTRVLACLISIAVFIPITLTLHKFLTTKDTYRMAPGKNGQMVNRTPWAKDSKVWPTYMYFGVAALALVLNLVILVSYRFGINVANKAATMTTWVIMIGNLVVWSVAASLYRSEKDKGGKANDLWGWTCSSAADKIQDVFARDVNFDKFCTTQTISFYVGLVQVAVGILTIFTYILVLRRRKVKKVKKAALDKERLLNDREFFGPER